MYFIIVLRSRLYFLGGHLVVKDYVLLKHMIQISTVCLFPKVSVYKQEFVIMSEIILCNL